MAKVQGLTNPLSGCPGQVKNLRVKYFLTCPEKCIRYIGKPKEIQYFVAEVLHQTSRLNFDLSSPESVFDCRVKSALVATSNKQAT